MWGVTFLPGTRNSLICGTANFEVQSFSGAVNRREVARSLVIFYHETKTKRDFLLKVSQVFGFACIDEARLVWDAIDEYVGSVNPSE